VFKILSLDGGGIRGAFIAAFLAKLQENLDQPLVKYFDLITGTSTGGLIAVALAMGIAPSDIRQLYENESTRIFARSPSELSKTKRLMWSAILRGASFGLGTPLGLDADWLYRSKFASAPLKEILRAKLGDRLLQEAQCRLAIPSVDLTTARIVVFKTPHRPNFVRDRNFRAVDVILATTAAPSYFPGVTIGQGSLYCDGGVWANNPALVGYVEAVKISQECLRPGIDVLFDQDSIQLLSVGTGRASYFAKPNVDSPGLMWWAPRLLNVSSEAQSEGIHWQMQYLLGARYTRIDFDIPEGDWSLDATNNIAALLHLGSDQATQQISNLRRTFLSGVSAGYAPFDQ
jgi:hypothetical protein